MHGQTFLMIRPELAQLLFEQRPDLRAFALSKLEREVREEIRTQFADATPQEQQAYLEARLAKPVPEELQDDLVAWLGEITAERLAGRIEAKATNEFLAGQVGDSDALVERLDARWDVLRNLFPPPTRYRSVALMHPVYDPAEERVGFYRVILPRPRLESLPLDMVPDHPYLLRLVRELARSPQGPEALRKLGSVSSVAHRGLLPEQLTPQAKKRYQSAFAGGNPLRRLRATFVSEGSPELQLEIYFLPQTKKLPSSKCYETAGPEEAKSILIGVLEKSGIAKCTEAIEQNPASLN